MKELSLIRLFVFGILTTKSYAQAPSFDDNPDWIENEIMDRDITNDIDPQLSLIPLDEFIVLDSTYNTVMAEEENFELSNTFSSTEELIVEDSDYKIFDDQAELSLPSVDLLFGLSVTDTNTDPVFLEDIYEIAAPFLPPPSFQHFSLGDLLKAKDEFSTEAIIFVFELSEIFLLNPKRDSDETSETFAVTSRSDSEDVMEKHTWRSEDSANNLSKTPESTLTNFKIPSIDSFSIQIVSYLYFDCAGYTLSARNEEVVVEPTEIVYVEDVLTAALAEHPFFRG